MEYIPTHKDKKSLRDTAFTMLSKILELSCDEFRGGYTIKKDHGNWVEDIYVPDSRKRISQAIEFFSFILQPFYDKDMKDKHKKIKDELEKNLKKYNDGKKSEENREDFTTNKLVLMKDLFEQINFLLHKKDYLKGESYDETQDEEEEEEKEEE